MKTELDMSPRRVDRDVDYCGFDDVGDKEKKHRLSRRYQDPVLAVAQWWENAMAEQPGNSRPDNERFVQKMAQSVDCLLCMGSPVVVVNLGKECCGARVGIIKDCILHAVGDVIKKAGDDATKAERKFYIPAAFFDNGNRVMYVTRNCVFIAVWNYETDFAVEKVLWVREGKDTARVIAQAYWADVCKVRLDFWDGYRTRGDGYAAIRGFCNRLFKAAHLPISCVARRSSHAPVEIRPESVDQAVVAVDLKLKRNRHMPNATMSIGDDSVIVTLPEREPFTVWKKEG